MNAARIVLFSFIGFLSGSHAAVESKSCTDLGNRITSERNSLEDLRGRRERLDAEFDNHVKEDFRAQTEGRVESSHRTAAIRARFDAKRLERVASSQEKSLTALLKEYCIKCSPSEPLVKKALACPE